MSLLNEDRWQCRYSSLPSPLVPKMMNLTMSFLPTEPQANSIPPSNTLVQFWGMPWAYCQHPLSSHSIDTQWSSWRDDWKALLLQVDQGCDHIQDNQRSWLSLHNMQGASKKPDLRIARGEEEARWIKCWGCKWQDEMPERDSPSVLDHTVATMIESTLSGTTSINDVPCMDHKS